MASSTAFLWSGRRCCESLCRVSPGLVLRSRVVRRDHAVVNRPFHTFARAGSDQTSKSGTVVAGESSKVDPTATVNVPTNAKSSSEGKLLQERVVSTSEQ